MRIWWGIGIVGIVSGCGAALAQGYPERRMDFTLSSRTTYDSNLLRRTTSTGITAPRQADDIRFTPTAHLEIVYPLSRQALFFNGSVGYDFYAHNTQLNRERLNLAGGADLRFGTSCGTRLTAEYVRQQSDLADLFAFTRLTNTEEIRAYEVQANCGDAYGLRPGGGYRHEEARNSTAELRRNNYNTDSFNAQIGYVRPTFGSLSFFSTYEKTSYPNRLIDVGGVRGDRVDIYTAGARFEREIGSRLRGGVSVGYTRADPKSSDVPDFGGISYSADLTYSPTDRFQLDVGFAREAQVSNNIDATYSVDETYNLDATFKLNQRVAIVYGASYATRDFRLSPTATPLLNTTGDKTYIGYVGARYYMSDRLDFDLNFTQQRRDADNPLFNYKSSQVSAGATLRF